MAPKKKIALYAISGIFGFSLAVLAVYYGHPFIAILLVVATTLFASLSKFAKEVKTIELWKKVTGGRYNDYPQTDEQRRAARADLHRLFGVVVRDFLSTKNIFDAGKIRYNGRHLGQELESRMARDESALEDFWRLLDGLDLIPFDPVDRTAWESLDAFIEVVSSDSEILHAALSV